MDENLFQSESQIMQNKKFKRNEALVNLCQRCRDLRFTNLEPKKELESAETLLAPFVSEFNREALMKEMFSKIFPRSVILYVCDMSNFEGS
jgi:hypothetical protein